MARHTAVGHVVALTAHQEVRSTRHQRLAVDEHVAVGTQPKARVCALDRLGLGGLLVPRGQFVLITESVLMLATQRADVDADGAFHLRNGLIEQLQLRKEHGVVAHHGGILGVLGAAVLRRQLQRLHVLGAGLFGALQHRVACQ